MGPIAELSVRTEWRIADEPATDVRIRKNQKISWQTKKFFQCQDSPVTRPWKNAANCGCQIINSGTRGL